jgi:hypothetical protein
MGKGVLAMQNDTPTFPGWYWWTPTRGAEEEVVYLTRRPPQGLVGTRFRSPRGVWRRVPEMGGVWGKACTPEEIERETATAFPSAPHPEEAFPLFI